MSLVLPVFTFTAYHIIINISPKRCDSVC